MTSQAKIVGSPSPKTWDDYERGCHATFGGGYREEAEREIFRHGMSTVFNLLRMEFPEASLAKAAPDLLAALKQILSACPTATDVCMLQCMANQTADQLDSLAEVRDRITAARDIARVSIQKAEGEPK